MSEDNDYVLWDQKQTSSALAIPINTLKDYRAKGKGPRSAVIGGRVMYRKSDVLTWIDERFAQSGRGGKNAPVAAFTPLGRRSVVAA